LLDLSALPEETDGVQVGQALRGYIGSRQNGTVKIGQIS